MIQIILIVLGVGIVLFMGLIWCMIKVGKECADISEEISMREE